MNKRILHIATVLIVMVSALATPLDASALNGEKSVGLRAGYTTSSDAPVAGLYFQYRFSKHFRLAPSLDYYFRHNGTDAFAFNINAEVPFALSVSGRFNVYPLAGLNVTSWNFRNRVNENGDDSSTRLTRFGLNVGAGAEYYCTKSLKVAFEAKYSYIRHYDGGNFTLSIGYVF